MMRVRALAGAVPALLLATATVAEAPQEAPNTCIGCHVEEEDEELSAPVAEWRRSVHARAEVTCDACHGGDPLEEDEELSMSEDDAGYVGAPSWSEVPAFCGACHEEILEGYSESVMAEHLEEGERVAVCTTCHMSEGHAIVSQTPREILTEERCGECHDADRAIALRDVLEKTSARIATVDQQVERVRGRIDTGRLDRELREIRKRHLVIAHTYDLDRISEVAQVCDERLQAVTSQADELIQEVRFRRNLGGGVVAFFIIASFGALRLERDLRRRAGRLALLFALACAVAQSSRAEAPVAKPAAHPGEAAASEAGNQCVSCHRRKETLRVLPGWQRDHFVLWSRGEHGLADVTCDACHGGQSDAPEKAASHAGIRPASDPESPVYFKNLPRTCGSCHEDVQKAFVHSRHYKELVKDRLAPSCNTCHGFLMEIARPSHLLVDSCELCHNREPDGVKPEIVDEARRALDHVARARRSIEDARHTVEIARDLGLETGRAAKRLRKAEQLLDETGARWHSFHLGAFESDLAEIQAMAEQSKNAAMDAILTR